MFVSQHVCKKLEKDEGQPQNKVCVGASETSYKAKRREGKKIKER